MNKFFYDSYERHKRIGSMIEDFEMVLDVGGQLSGLSRFVKNKTKIVVANVEGAQEASDVVIKKGKLPYRNGAFEVVCSIDVLEHIPKDKRKFFILELLRVASKKIVVSFPIGTIAHMKYEKDMMGWLKKNGHKVDYLEEHIRYGLPSVSEVTAIVEKKNFKIEYSGDIFVNEFLFKLFMFDPKVKYIRRAVYVLKLLFNSITNDVFYLFLAKRNFSERVNRAYLTIYKK